ncbi:MAG: hypothetical protein JXB42_08985 [Deltaproteobacteria bacterium]|nr:hypothetical protein [Deltaproteobacteria bacterium]
MKNFGNKSIDLQKSLQTILTSSPITALIMAIATRANDPLKRFKMKKPPKVGLQKKQPEPQYQRDADCPGSG